MVIENTHHQLYIDKVIPVFNIYIRRGTEVQMHSFLTFWRQNYFFLILAHTVYKM